MLVLSRKVGEEVLIGEEVRVRVVAVQGGQVRLGFEAPRSVDIKREELCQPAQSPTGGPDDGHPRPSVIVERAPHPVRST